MLRSGKKYPIAPNGIFPTVQGEGHLIGVPMNFVRLAGCSIGCSGCDTNYTLSERLTVSEIETRLDTLPRCEWAWVTGGEPADYDLLELLEALRIRGRVAVATSGHKAINAPASLIDFLSVSPHGSPAKLAIRMGSQINLVPGLNGLGLAEWEGFDLSPWKCGGFVTPIWHHQGERMERTKECIEFVCRNPGFRLGVQAHKFWGVA